MLKRLGLQHRKIAISARSALFTFVMGALVLASVFVSGASPAPRLKGTKPPSGTIIFSALPRGAPRSDIYTIRADGSRLYRLTRTASIRDESPAWSPDGRTIAVVQTVGSGKKTIWLLRPDGSRIRRVSPRGRNAHNPAWSPDGKWLAFDSNLSRAGRRDLYIVNRDGSGLRRFVFPRISAVGPAWSPDGKRIAFWSATEFGWAPRNWESSQGIWALEVDTGRLTRLTRPGDHPDPLWSGDDRRPDWSPNGREIVYTQGVLHLAVLDIATRRVTPLKAEGIDPTWSPDGTHIAYDALRGITIANPDGTTVLNITGAFTPCVTIEPDLSNGIGQNCLDWSRTS